MNSKIKVMLVEDHAGYREVITLALKREKDIELISQFGTAEIALRELQNASKQEHPELILLDLNLPGISGLEALPLFIKKTPGVKIIILTQSDRKEDVLNAISNGASGYLLKSATVQQIREGIQTVISGGASLDSGMAKHILDAMRTNTMPGTQENLITEREREVLSLLGDGLVKKEIADQLNISVSTVVDHVRNIYDKLEVQNAPSAIHKAHKLGIFSKKSTDS
jgi:DNA-binding NarL/FixJ family response regulator